MDVVAESLVGGRLVGRREVKEGLEEEELVVAEAEGGGG
jgi:hypothetical protein